MSFLSLKSKIFTRGKRTVRQAPGAARVVNMLAVLSARKKMPRRLRFCMEDIIRHSTVLDAFKVFKRDFKIANEKKMEIQYNKIREACEELEKTDLKLFEASRDPADKRFPIELRVPTDTPPRTPWEKVWK